MENRDRSQPPIDSCQASQSGSFTRAKAGYRCARGFLPQRALSSFSSSSSSSGSRASLNRIGKRREFNYRTDDRRNLSSLRDDVFTPRDLSSSRDGEIKISSVILLGAIINFKTLDVNVSRETLNRPERSAFTAPRIDAIKCRCKSACRLLARSQLTIEERQSLSIFFFFVRRCGACRWTRDICR